MKNSTGTTQPPSRDVSSIVIQSLNIPKSRSEPVDKIIWQGSHEDDSSKEKPTQSTDQGSQECLPLKGMKVYVEIYSNGKEISETCYGYLEALGATIEKKMNKKCNVVLWKDGTLKTLTKAKEYGVNIVNSLWLEDCIENFKCADFKKYMPNLPTESDMAFMELNKNKKRKTMEPKRLCWSPKSEKEYHEFTSSPIQKKRVKQRRESERDYGLEAKIEIRLGCQKKVRETFDNKQKVSIGKTSGRQIEEELPFEPIELEPIEENKSSVEELSQQQNLNQLPNPPLILEITDENEALVEETDPQKERTFIKTLETDAKIRNNEGSKLLKGNKQQIRENWRRACSEGGNAAIAKKSKPKSVAKESRQKKPSIKRSVSSIVPQRSQSDHTMNSMKMKIVIPLANTNGPKEKAKNNVLALSNKPNTEGAIPNSLEVKISIPLTRGRITTKEPSKGKEAPKPKSKSKSEEKTRKVVQKSAKPVKDVKENKQLKTQKKEIKQEKEEIKEEKIEEEEDDEKTLMMSGFTNKDKTVAKNFGEKFGFSLCEEEKVDDEGILVYGSQGLEMKCTTATAMLKDRPIIFKSWMIDSLKDGKLKDYKQHEFKYKSNKKKKVFAGKKVFIEKEIAETGTARKDLIDMVKLAGGEICENMKDCNVKVVRKIPQKTADSNKSIKFMTVQDLISCIIEEREI